jgi:hypothetical protein
MMGRFLVDFYEADEPDAVWLQNEFAFCIRRKDRQLSQNLLCQIG